MKITQDGYIERPLSPGLIPFQELVVSNIRRVVGQAIGGTLATTGFVSWSIAAVRSAGLVTHVYFHQPSAAVFRDCISWLLKRGYHAISTAEIEEAIAGERKLPPLSLHVSLDDAWRSNLTEVVPVAQSLDIPITIFVPTEPILCGHYWWTSVESVARDKGRTVERLKRVPDEERRAYVGDMTRESELPREAMTLDELRSIARLKNVTIGSHTLTHPILPNCSDAVLEREVAESKSTLERWLGTSVTSFAYPNGDFAEREYRAVQRAGYRTAFTTLQTHGWPGKTDPLALPRFALLNDAAASENVLRATGLWLTDGLNYSNPLRMSA